MRLFKELRNQYLSTIFYSSIPFKIYIAIVPFCLFGIQRSVLINTQETFAKTLAIYLAIVVVVTVVVLVVVVAISPRKLVLLLGN